MRAAVAVDAVEVAAAGEAAPLAPAQPPDRASARASAACGPCAGGAGGSSRPERVRIRARKPWVGRACASSAARSASSERASLQSGAAGDGGVGRGRSGMARRASCVVFPANCGGVLAGSAAGAGLYGRSPVPEDRSPPDDDLDDALGAASATSSRASLPAVRPSSLWLEPLRAGRASRAHDSTCSAPGVGPRLGRAPLRRRVLEAVCAASAGELDRDRLRRRGAAPAPTPATAGAPESLPLDPDSHLRPLRDRPRQPPRPRRRARRRRARPARPTTRSSCTARPGSARPTCSARSPNYLRRNHPELDGPLHDRRALHRPSSSRALRRDGPEALQGSATASSTRC